MAEGQKSAFENPFGTEPSMVHTRQQSIVAQGSALAVIWVEVVEDSIIFAGAFRERAWAQAEVGPSLSPKFGQRWQLGARLRPSASLNPTPPCALLAPRVSTFPPPFPGRPKQFREPCRPKFPIGRPVKA